MKNLVFLQTLCLSIKKKISASVDDLFSLNEIYFREKYVNILGILETHIAKPSGKNMNQPTKETKIKACACFDFCFFMTVKSFFRTQALLWPTKANSGLASKHFSYQFELYYGGLSRCKEQSSIIIPIQHCFRRVTCRRYFEICITDVGFFVNNYWPFENYRNQTHNRLYFLCFLWYTK